MSYQKLVRDRIPEIIEASGRKPVWRELDQTEYQAELYRKLNEEWQEYQDAESVDAKVEELADVSEVLRSIDLPDGARTRNITKLEHALAFLGVDKGVMLEIQQQKAIDRGRFSRRIYLEGVEDPSARDSS